MNAKQKIERAAARMLLAYPWWSTLYLHLRVVESTSISTAATDGTLLLYNPDYVLTLSDSDCIGLLMHETAHCALMHPFRRGSRQPFLWNIACDQAVNALLLADGITLPPGCVPPAPLDKTAEELYEKITDQMQKQHGQDPRDVFSPGELGDSGESGGENIKGSMTESAWRDVLASCRGYEPASISRTVHAASEPRVNWRAELAQFVHAMRKAEWRSWSRPSRRIAGLPGWRREPECSIAVCVDTSGSVSEQILNRFLTEVKSIVNMANIKTWLISCDAAVHQCIEPGEALPSAFVGGGGTDFRPAIEKSLALEVDAIIYFTDGNGIAPQGCTTPVLWALTKHVEMPFGKSIILEGEQ